jgi:rhomboid protease GluP
MDIAMKLTNMAEDPLPEEETTAQQDEGRADEPVGGEEGAAPGIAQHPEVPAVYKPTFQSMRPSTHLITFVLIGVNVLIFILMVSMGVGVFNPTTESILNWGANFKPLTLQGEWWRLLTNFFIHIGLFHLLFNMYALLYVGLFLEPLLGRTRYLVSYLLTGLMASVASLWWHDLTVSAGASGAIFGLYGVFLAMLTTNLIERSVRKPLLISIALFVAYNLLYGTKGGIDNAAHIGGLVSGLLIGYGFYNALKNPDSSRLRSQTLLFPAVIVLLIAFGAYKLMPNDIGTYDQRIKEFAPLEQKGLDYGNKFTSFPKGKHRNTLEAKSLECWNESMKLIAELDKLNLPPVIHERNKKLLQYCELRIKSVQLIYQALEEDTGNYNDQIQEYIRQTQAIINELKG